MTNNSPTFSITYDKRADYIYALLTGEELTEQSLTSCFREIAAKCDELKCQRVLIENEVRMMPPLKTLYQIVATFRRLNDGRKTAFVNSHGRNYGKTDFMFLAYRRLGGDGEAFGRVSFAEDWLLRDRAEKADGIVSRNTNLAERDGNNLKRH